MPDDTQEKVYHFVISSNPRGDYITPFRMYPVLGEFMDSGVFLTVDDDDDIITCGWHICTHGGEWRHIKIPASEIEDSLLAEYKRKKYRMMEE